MQSHEVIRLIAKVRRRANNADVMALCEELERRVTHLRSEAPAVEAERK